MPEIRAFVQGISPAINSVILRAMAKNRDHRFATAGAFADALRQAQHNPTNGSFSKSTKLQSLLRPSLAAIKTSWRKQTRVWLIGMGFTFLLGIYFFFVAFSPAPEKIDPTIAVDKTEKSTSDQKSVTQAFGSIGNSFKQLGSAVGSSFRGTLNDTLAMSLTAADSAVRRAIKRQGLVITKEKTDETQSRIETKMADKENLTITLKAQGKSTTIAIQIGVMGDEKRSKTVLNWIKEE